MTHNFGRAAGSRPVLHPPQGEHPHGPFAATLAPALIARARGEYSPNLSLALLTEMPDVDGAHGALLLSGVEVRLEDEDTAHLAIAEPAAVAAPNTARSIGLGLVNAIGTLEAFGRLSDINYFNLEGDVCLFPAHSIRVRGVIPAARRA